MDEVGDERAIWDPDRAPRQASSTAGDEPLGMSKPKQIGTWTETHTARAAQGRGFPYAERHVLKGSADEGDVWLDSRGRAIVECKGGHAAETASDEQIRLWLDEAEAERVNAGAERSFLVTKRAGKGAAQSHRWWAHVGLDSLVAARLGVVGAISCTAGAIVRLPLEDMLALLAPDYGEV